MKLDGRYSNQLKKERSGATLRLVFIFCALIARLQQAPVGTNGGNNGTIPAEETLREVDPSVDSYKKELP